MYVSSDSTIRIIDPLASRCAKFRFKPLEGQVMQNRLKQICKEENLAISAEVTIAPRNHDDVTNKSEW